MQGVGAGRPVADRYTLTTRRAHLGDIEVWSATDNTLGREVSVTLFPTDLPQAEAILDAARQSAVLNDHRLVRVLDVGSRDGMSWLVEESLAESSSLAELIAQGPLPPEEARRVAGEIATAIEGARRRGLHHLHLTPYSVRRTESGIIKIAGLGTAAAVEGTRIPDAATAARTDTHAIVALLYAAVTTRWPSADRMPGLEPAPRVGGGFAAPSEIALAVPPDLDALCRATLNHRTGPSTPSQLIDRLGPWSTTRVGHVDPRPTSSPPAAKALTQVIPAVTGPATAGPAQPVGSFARVAAHHKEQKAKERAAKAAATRRRLEERRADPGFLNLPEALEERRGEVDAPLAPLIPTVPEQEGRHAKLVLGLVSAVVVVALGLSIPALQNSFSPTAATTPTRSATPGPSGSSASASPSTAAPATSGGPIAIVSARGFDPEGNNGENDSKAAAAFDGRKGTYWESEGYKADEKPAGKAGVGIIFEIPKGSTVSRVALTLTDEPQDVAVYASDTKDLEDATEIGSEEGATGEVEVSASTPVTDARYVIVWFTKLAPDGTRYRARIAEVGIS